MYSKPTYRQTHSLHVAFLEFLTRCLVTDVQLKAGILLCCGVVNWKLGNLTLVRENSGELCVVCLRFNATTLLW